MTFNEYLKSCEDLIKENPEIGTFQVVYSIDDEGNAFHKVQFKPTVGEFTNNEFTDLSDAMTPNAVCIN